MGTKQDAANEVLTGIRGIKEKLSELPDSLTKMAELLKQGVEVDSQEEININGKKVRVTVLKRGIISINFQNLQDAKDFKNSIIANADKLQ